MKGENFKVVGKLDPAPLLLALAGQDLWCAGERERFEGSPHAQAKSILVRWVSRQPTSVNIVLDSTDSVDYPAAALLMPAVGNAVMAVLESLEGPVGDLGHVMLTKLPQGGSIAKHMDEGVYADFYDRFHVCLKGDIGNRFICGDETFHPKPGQIFWFNHKRWHSVENLAVGDGLDLDRIHLIVDVMAPRYTARRGIYYQAEKVSTLWDESRPLLEAHWREIAHYPDIPLDPDVDAYWRLEQEGMLRCYTARDAGKLIGYVVFIVRPNLHYKGSLQATQDVLFVLPEYRVGMVGVRLIKTADERLAAEGVQVVYHHAKLSNRVGELLDRLGYETVEGVHAKRLDRREKP